MWSAYLHHIFLHFSLVLPFVTAAIGFALRDRGGSERVLVRWLGWTAFGATSIVAVTGLVAAEYTEPIQNPTHMLPDHRNLGITGWVATLIAAWSVEYGWRHEIEDSHLFGLGVWLVAGFVLIGAAHWGSGRLHAEIIPW